MSTITWLHLSDFQFQVGEQQAWNEDTILQRLLKDVSERIETDGLRPDFIVITGDVAYSGRPAEYDQARQFLDTLLRVVGLGKDRLFLVPGNHDVDRDLVSQGARVIATSLVDPGSVRAVLASARWHK